MAVKPVNPADRGVIPDYIIYQSITEIAKHTDAQLAYALSIAEKNE